MTIKSPKKLIEVALPLDKINEAAAREKSIRHGHPSTLHLWWARRPLAAARAVIFAQMVNDPGFQQGGGFKYGKNKVEAAKERQRLFRIIEKLVLWENTTNEDVLEEARVEIRRSWREVCELNRDHPQAAELFNPDQLPAFHDPFAGGGALPLEAQRLGLTAYASDLNPVAVTINKAMIEIPPKFAGREPVGPLPKGEKKMVGRTWPGATGLAEDVRRYGAWMREEAEKRIGHLYPPVKITDDMAQSRPDLQSLVGQKLTVIAWIWARTVKSPNPAFSHVHVPLASTFVLSSKAGKEAYVQPVVEGDDYWFQVKVGVPPEKLREGTKASGKGGSFVCLLSGAPISSKHIKEEGQGGRIGARLMAIVAEGTRGRVFLPPTDIQESISRNAIPSWKPDIVFFQQALGFRVGNYGMSKWSDLFTSRQLVALTTLSDLVQEVRVNVLMDAIKAHWINNDQGLDAEGDGAAAYSDAVTIYLSFLVDQIANHASTICGWNHPNTQMRSVFSRQAISMTWDYAEANVFSGSSGSYSNLYERQIKGFESLNGKIMGISCQTNASNQKISQNKIVSTDPPYYDNIGYADLSDFFYVWLRKNLKPIFPNLYATLTAPKEEELVATPHRHGGQSQAEAFFLNGMIKAIRNIAECAHPAFPVTIYYAFKQAETKSEKGTHSTGWETFLAAVLSAGFAISGTWPMRTEKPGRARENDSSALASSIVLVCRKRPIDALTISRREFIRELNAVLPEALDEMTRGTGADSPVAPVDLSQSIIGPGMAIFSKYAAVLEADGSPMTVRTALQLINRFIAEDDFDADTRFCLHWFEQFGWGKGAFGQADILARAKGTSVDGVRNSGVLESGGGDVRLFKWAEYPKDWDPIKDVRLPVWEALHQLIRVLRHHGETPAGKILAAMRQHSDAIRQLSYRLYTLCERKGWAEDARAYNDLITSWDSIDAAAGKPVAGERIRNLPGL